MSHIVKSKAEKFVRVILTIIVLFNAVIPTTALAMPSSSTKASAPQANNIHNSLPASEPIYYQPSAPIPNPSRFSPQADEKKPETPVK